MKVIGRVELKATDSGEVLNLPYVGGYIVELTEQETNLLRLLQDSCKGLGWDMARMFDHFLHKPEDVDMAEAFKLIHLFVRTRFAIADFKQMATELESILNRLEE